MSYYSPNQTLRAPQDDTDNAPIRTPLMGYNNVLHHGFFKSQRLPNMFTTEIGRAHV